MSTSALSQALLSSQRECLLDVSSPPPFASSNNIRIPQTYDARVHTDLGYKTSDGGTYSNQQADAHICHEKLPEFEHPSKLEDSDRPLAPQLDCNVLPFYLFPFLNVKIKISK